MKTDFERTEAFLQSLGIAYGIVNNSISFGDATYTTGCDYPPCDKVGGFTGFYTKFDFDEQGKF